MDIQRGHMLSLDSWHILQNLLIIILVLNSETVKKSLKCII